MGRSSFRSAVLWLGATALAWASQGAAGTADPSGEKVAIVVGVQRYSETKGFAPLRYAERDAESFYGLLVDPQRGGYDPARVKLFTTASQDPQQLPVRGYLLAALNHLEDWASTAGGGALDTVLIYFSGHGVTEGRRSYLIPVDASRDDLASTAISLEEVEARLARCGAKKQIIILDACRFQTTPGKGAGESQAVSFAKKLEELGRAQGRVVLASCGENEASYEDEASRHSAFTAFLLQGLLGPADADADGVITVTESLEYVSREMLPWSRQQELQQTPRLYGEISLTLPLVRCPQWGELRITSVPSDAEVFIDGQSTGQRTPYASRIKLEQGRSRVLKLSLRRSGYQALEKEVALAAGAVSELGLALTEQPRLAAHMVPRLRPALADWTVSTFYAGAGYVSGLAPRPDGSVLVAVAVPQAVPQGVYVAYPGDECDTGDAYGPPGDPLKWPDGVWLHPDGRVFVTESPTSTIWMIPAPGATSQVFTRSIVEPYDILIAPAGFDGPQVHPGDFLVCAGGSDPTQAGLWVLDQKGLAPRRLVGPPALANGLIHAALGPDGTLYAMEDDAARDGVTIVAISPHGDVTLVLANHMVSLHARQAGPLALHAVTGDIYFAYGPSVYQLSHGTGKVETVATAGGDITALAYRPGGIALVVGDAGASQVVELRQSPPGAPKLQVEISRGYIHDGSGRAGRSYRQTVHVIARDENGAGDIASVTIVDPNGGTHVLTPESGPWTAPAAPVTSGDWYSYAGRGVARWQQQEGNGIACFWGECGLSQPPNGHYTITATDRSGNSTTLTTQKVPPPDDIYLELLSPGNGSVITDNAPLFSWRCDRPGCAYGVEVSGEDGPSSDRIWVWEAPNGAEPKITYNADGRAQLPVLVPGHIYGCAVGATCPEEPPMQDPQVKVHTCAQVWGNFAVFQEWPQRPPELAGKLAYNLSPRGWFGQTGMAYSRDPSVRMWLNGAPDWSPDGTRLLSMGPIVGALDGTPPVVVPRAEGWDARWSPDGQRIAYVREGPWSPFAAKNADIHIADTDGSHSYALVDSIECGECHPAWSPDGLWIAYHRYTGPDNPAGAGLPGDPVRVGQGAWIVRYDGREDHPLDATGVRGYPGYEVISLKPGTWSPDVSLIAVAFGAELATSRGAQSSATEGAAIWGIGTIAPEGGEVTPVFVAPPGAVCCAGPTDPIWSPGGEKIVFSSAHHLKQFRGRGEFELGVELWMANADGSGEPVRLTYDDRFTHRATWWAPNTEPGSQVKVVKGDASATFETVTEAGCTSLVAYLDPPQSLPEGSRFAGLRYELATTAKVSGAIGLEIHYEKKSIPAGREHGLRLLHHEGDRWVDVTADPVDAVSDTIRGRCTTPGAFALAVAP